MIGLITLIQSFYSSTKNIETRPCPPLPLQLSEETGFRFAIESKLASNRISAQYRFLTQTQKTHSHVPSRNRIRLLF